MCLTHWHLGSQHIGAPQAWQNKANAVLHLKLVICGTRFYTYACMNWIKIFVGTNALGLPHHSHNNLSVTRTSREDF
ncbi:hypothetical protein Hanom_Chr01g00073241 [Helianthus anomalus]